MKKCILLASIIIATISCKQDKKLQEISGDYLFYDNIAIIQTDTEIYSVIISYIVND